MATSRPLSGRQLPGRALLCLICLLTTLAVAQPQDDGETPPRAQAWLVDIDDVVGPATTDHVLRTLEEAHEADAPLLILRMDTPGGLDSSMRALIKGILESPIPVVTWVAPAGSRAASAGTYILYASHIAAMAPSTHLGAATPVTMGGMPGAPETAPEAEDEPAARDKPEEQADDSKRRGGTAMERKMLEDAVAYIRSLAELRGRNPEWAEQAVREGFTLTAPQALKRNVIDVLATDTRSLLEQIHGREVTMDGDATLTLDTAGLTVHQVEPDWRTRLLTVITNPNVAYLLMMIGFYGLVFEFASPGQIYPGVIGTICLVLALYAFQVLPVSYAGMGLILLGLAFMAAEAFVPSFGVLGLGGLIAFAMGSVILLDDAHMRISLPAIAGTALVSLGLFSWVLGRLWKLRNKAPLGGHEEMLLSSAVALADFVDEGWVRVHGEAWRARSAQPVHAGQHLRIVAINGLMLDVEPAE